MSSELVWSVIRDSSCFIVKQRNEKLFSREPSNLLNRHSFKYSGLANKKAIGVSVTAAGPVVTLKKRVAGSKPSAGVATVAYKKPYGVAKKGLAKLAKDYRADLASAAVLRLKKATQKPKAVKAPKRRVKTPKA